MKALRFLKYSFSYSVRSPISTNLVKTESGREQIKKRLELRYKSASLLDQEGQNIAQEDLHMYEQLSQQSNTIKKQIKQQINQKRQENIQQMKDTLKDVKISLQNKQNRLKISKKQYQDILQCIGNSIHEETPISSSQDHNKILKYYHPQHTLPGVRQNSDHQQFVQRYFQGHKYDYNQLTQKFGIADLPRGQKVSGHRGYFLCSNGLKLALALAQYGIDFMQQRGYSLFQTPAFILQSVLKDSCQLQSIQTDMYRFRQDNLCLIATSEQSLAGYHRSQTFQPKQLPKKMAGYSSCFRRQAGAHGKDIQGLFRLHQFEKVQQFIICHPSQSEAMMAQMVHNAEHFFQSLNIPYRLVDIVSGQLNDAAIRKIDLEGWYPGQKRFRQLVSISNCTDYQARMLQTKFRQGRQVKYPHMLNGTLLAIQRAMTCMLEHFYSQEENVIKIPQALQPYIRAKHLKPV